MNTTTILYARSNTIPGIAIRNFDNIAPNRWSHVGINYKNNLVIEATLLNGVRRSSVEQFKNKYSKIDEVVYYVPNKDVADSWLLSQIGKKYDYLAIFGKLFGRKSWQEADKWHCNELVEAYLTVGGTKRFRDGPWNISPNLGYMVISGTADNKERHVD